MGNIAIERQPFGIPKEQLRRPIQPELLMALGLDEHADQNELYLAIVVLEGRSDANGKQWLINAHSALDGGKSINYGAVGIVSETDEVISPETALEVATDWILGSPTTESVPSNLLITPTIPEPNMVRGLLLVRAKEAKSKSEPQVFHVNGVDITVQEVREEGGELLAAAADGKWVKFGAQTPEQARVRNAI